MPKRRQAIIWSTDAYMHRGHNEQHIIITQLLNLLIMH